MPSGPIHAKITKTVALGAVLSLFWLNFDDFLALESGILLTLKVNPDLDIHNHLGILGNIVGFDEYKKVIPHRAGLRPKDWQKLFGSSPRGERPAQPWQIALFSHLPWLGTAPRTLMLLAPLVLTLAMFDLHGFLDPNWLLWLWQGMAISDLAHSTADLVDTYQKEHNPGWWKNKESEDKQLKRQFRQAAKAQRREMWKK